MLFWLTFIQSLPIASTTELASIESPQTRSTLQEPTRFPVTTQAGTITSLAVFPALIGTLVLLLLMSVWAFTRVYVITPTNEAFVRTGGVFAKRKTVILNGVCVILPGFHELT